MDRPLRTFRWSPWRWLVRLFLVGFALTVALALAEVGLRGLVAVKRASRLETVVRLVNHDWPFSSEGWAYRFYNAYSSGAALIQDSLYRVHPTRGWTCSPNISMWRGEYHYTTNRFGHRGPFTPRPDSRKIKVMLLGDSQTFGEEVDDIFAWPNILASQHRELEIINLSVGGYGLDQMYVTFTEEFEFWKPDIVVFAPIPDDLYRSSLWFRDFSKPYFEPVYGGGGEVKELIPHAPVTEMSQLLQNLKSNRAVIGRKIKLISLFTSVMDLRITTDRNWVRSHDINSELMRRVLTRTGREGVPVALVLIGNLGSRQRGRDLSNPAEVQYWRICDRFSGQGLICPDWKKVAGTRGEFTPEGHYKRLGNELIAELVWGGIESLVATRTAPESGKL